MPEILIPLVGIIEVDIETLGKVGMIVGKSVLIHDVKIDDDLWLYLVSQKIEGRFKNLNDVIRVKFGFPRLNPPVKRYSDEGVKNGITE